MLIVGNFSHETAMSKFPYWMKGFGPEEELVNGMDVVNRAENLGLSREFVLEEFIRELLECGAVVTLPDWEEDETALRVVQVARMLGREVWFGPALSASRSAQQELKNSNSFHKNTLKS